MVVAKTYALYTQSLLTPVLELAGHVSCRVATSCRQLFWDELLGELQHFDYVTGLTLPPLYKTAVY